jgi:hypothetical protein
MGRRGQSPRSNDFYLPLLQAEVAEGVSTHGGTSLVGTGRLTKGGGGGAGNKTVLTPRGVGGAFRNYSACKL